MITTICIDRRMALSTRRGWHKIANYYINVLGIMGGNKNKIQTLTAAGNGLDVEYSGRTMMI